MMGIRKDKMQQLTFALQHVDKIGGGMSGNKTDLLRMLHDMLPKDDIELMSRFFTSPGEDVAMTDANCIKLKLFMAIGIMNTAFNAHFKFILRGGFAVRMNILKKIQNVGPFEETIDMAKLISTVSNTDLDCLVMPVHDRGLSPEDQTEIIRLLQLSIQNTAESFKMKHIDTLLPKMDDVRKHELESTQKRMQMISMRRDAITGEDADSQTQKQLLNDFLQKLQKSMTTFTLSAAVANPADFGLTIRPAKHSALTTKINWKTNSSEIELMDVSIMPAHDASSLYADASRMKYVKSRNTVWYYPGCDTLLIEYLNVMHDIDQNIRQTASDPLLPPEDKESQLIMQSRMLEKFKSRSKICYKLLDEEDRVKLDESLSPQLNGELKRALHKGGARSTRSKNKNRIRRTRTKKCTRQTRTKKRNSCKK